MTPLGALGIEQVTDAETRRVLQLLDQRVQQALDQLDATDLTTLLTPTVAEARYGPEAMRFALSARPGAAAPLNVENLKGRLADPQRMRLRRVEVLPSFGRPDELIMLGTALYFWDTTQTAWVVIGGVGEPQRGTISPNQKPTLGVGDVGWLFTATDFDRTYRWSGTAWADAPGQPARGQILFFESALAPGTGWQLCDGTATTRSTPTGTTTAYTVPNITGSSRFIRGVAGGTGGTGGTSTHVHTVNPPNTTSGAPSALETVDNDAAVSTVDVGSDVHTHDTDIAQFNSGSSSTLPLYYDLRPYVRL